MVLLEVLGVWGGVLEYLNILYTPNNVIRN